MSAFFSRERFGRPQILAGLMLLVFIAECAWVVAHEAQAGTSEDEIARVREAVAQWHGHGIAGTRLAGVEEIPFHGEAYDSDHSPLWYAVGATPMAFVNVEEGSDAWIWLTRGPYMLFGTLLGASAWYVSRRLYGNAGGYVVLALYCFSPTVIRASTLWFSPPNIGAAWGTFGAVFTAIAVSHTLYAPREVVLWNWRRIVLLGVSLALAVGSQFELAMVVPVLLVLMLYVAPERKGAAAVILAAACGIAVLLLFASYFFHARVFWESLMNARWVDFNARALTMPGAYAQVAREIKASGPVLALLAPASLIAFAVWRRSRYFGNIAPLIMAALFLGWRVLSPHEPESVLTLAGLIFLIVFVGGIAADLLETKAREMAEAILAGLVSANGLWNLIVLVKNVK